MIEISKRDSELAQRVLQGDERDYTVVLKLYRESVYYMMLKMIYNKDDAEDLTIEVFGKAFKRLASYDTSWVFSTWLFKIASNNCVNQIRKKKKQENPINMDSGYSDDDDDNECTIYLERYAEPGRKADERATHQRNTSDCRAIKTQVSVASGDALFEGIEL